MGATFQSIQTRVTTRLIDVPSATVAEVPARINDAILYAQRRHNFKVMEQLAILVTVKNTRILAGVPTNWKEQRKGDCWYVDLNGAPVKVFTRPTLEAVLAQYSYDDPTEVGDPHVLLEIPTGSSSSGGSEGPPANILVWPFPDGQSQFGTGSVTVLKDPLGNTITVPSGEYPIFVPYWGYVPQLVASGDQNWFTDNAEDYTVFRALAEAFYMNWDEQRAKMWEARAEDRLREVIKLDKSRRVGRTNQLAVYRDAYGPRGTRWWNGFTQVPGE